jgi:hypothetical protein
MIKKPIYVSVLANFQLARGNATTALFFWQQSLGIFKLLLLLDN